MSFVATLISSPARPAVSEALTQASYTALGATRVEWLKPGVAVDLLFNSETEIKSLEATLRELIGDQPVDCVVQPLEGRRKRLLLADMDSTMIGQECIDELAAEVGLKDHVAAITARAMAGELEFEPALRERVALLKGLPCRVVDQVIANRITLTPGGKQLIATMKAHGAHTALVSGGFTVFTSKIAATIGFDENRANILLEENGKLAGLVAEPILGKQAKLDSLIELSAARGLTLAQTMAVGDGANDLAMIEAAGLGVALHAKPKVAEAARVRIDHGDLTALLYVQGYRAAEFVGGYR